MKRRRTTQGLAGAILVANVILTVTALESRGQVSVDGGPNFDEAVLFSFDDHAIPWRDNVVGDRTMMWYSHWDTGGKLQNMEIGLATMRRDGFGYLARKVADSPAHIVTAPVATATAARIFVNVEGVSAETPLTVELLDEFDRPMPNYSGDKSALVSAAGTRTEVVWSKPTPTGETFAFASHIAESR